MDLQYLKVLEEYKINEKELPEDAKNGIKEIKNALRLAKLRESKGMLANSGINSAGSFFMNPVISKDDAVLLPEGAPKWQQADGAIKTSAAWLIEQAGFTKGYSRGNAGISSKHVLALVNNGGASAMSIVELAMEIRDTVRNKFGIALQPEVQLSGIKFI